jgi:V/A-type H+-transporting ATPase subunit K
MLSNDIPLSQGLMALGAGLSVGIAGLSAIGQGIAAGTGVSITVTNPKNFGKGLIFSVLPETQAIYGLLVAIFLLYGSGIISGGPTPLMTMAGALGIGLAGVGVGLGMGISGITAIGQGIAASAGAAATAEKPEMFSRGIIMAVLPETQSIYALLVSILILNALGVLTVSVPASYTAYQLALIGLGAIGAGFAVGIAGVSGIGQGITAGAGVSATSRNPQAFTSSLILAVMSETFAIFGLLIAIFIMIAMGVL